MSDPTVVFPHHKLDAYRVALELAVAARGLVATMPRGHAGLADQLSRASVSVVMNIAEGANRSGTGEKRQKFSIARGEVGEVAAGIELASALGLVPGAETAAALELASRVAAMLTRLIQRFGG